MTAPGRPLVVLGLIASFAACGVNGLAFRQDHRVDIVRPTDRSEVTVPFDLEWTADDSASTVAGFGVLVDREPPPPGRTLSWLFRDDARCRGGECPDERLAEANVFRTTATALTIGRLPALPANAAGLHDIVIVLLDAQGRRIGESGFRLQVREAEEGS